MWPIHFPCLTVLPQRVFAKEASPQTVEVELNLQRNKKAYFIKLYKGQVDRILKIWQS